MIHKKQLLITVLFIVALLFPLVSASPELIQQARNEVSTWQTQTNYETNQLVKYEEIIYKVIQTHISQEGWQPPNVPALFSEYSFQDLGEITVWKQPTGVQDSYNEGDRVEHLGIIYKSIIEANVWKPSEHPNLWENLGTPTELREQGQSVVIDGNVIYNSFASITIINGSNDLTSVELEDKRITATKNTEENNIYQLTFYTGNHNIPYAIRNEETGEVNQRIYSNEGYLTTTVRGFSTWTATIPDCIIGFSDRCDYAPLENYISSPNDVTQINVLGASSEGVSYDIEMEVDLTNPPTSNEVYTIEDYIWSALFISESTPRVLLFDIETEDSQVTNPIEQTYNMAIWLNGNIALGNTFDVTIINDTTPQSNEGLTDAIHYWSFDEGTGTTAEDLGSGQRDLTDATNLWTTSGKINGGLQSDNSSRVSATGTFGSFTDFSLNFWINIPEYKANNWIGVDTNSQINLRVSGGGSLRLNILDTGWFNVGSISLDTWHMITIVREGSTIKTYINNVEEDSRSISGTISPNTFYLMGNGGSSRYNGKLDEFLVYDFGITTTQIEELYNNGEGLNPYAEQLPPEQIASIATQIINVSSFGIADFLELDYDNYFNYAEIDYAIINYELSNGTTGTINHTIGTSEKMVKIPTIDTELPFTEFILVSDVRILYLVNDAVPSSRNSTWNMQLCNEGGCNNTDFDVEVIGIGEGNLFNPIPDKNALFNEVFSIFVDEHINVFNYTNLTLTYNDTFVTVDLNNDFIHPDIEIIDWNSDGTRYTISVFETIIEDLEITINAQSNREYSTGTYKIITETFTLDVAPMETPDVIQELPNRFFTESGTYVLIDDYSNYWDTTTEYDLIRTTFPEKNGVLNTDYTNISDLPFTSEYEGINVEVTTTGINVIVDKETLIEEQEYVYQWTIGLCNEAQETFFCSNQQFQVIVGDGITINPPSKEILPFNTIRFIELENIFQGENLTYYINYSGVELFFSNTYLVALEDETIYTGIDTDITFNNITNVYTDTETSNEWNYSDVLFFLCLVCVDGKTDVTALEQTHEDSFIIGAYESGNLNNIGEEGLWGEVTQEFSITETGEPTTPPPSTIGVGVGSFIQDFLGFFPSREDLGLAGSMLLVIIIMGVTLGVGYAMTVLQPESSTLLTIGYGVLLLAEFVFFVALGYIPIWILVLGSIAVTTIALTIGKSVIVGRND